ncbi:MAG: molybdopterin-guanine dinucleotide biosynthesis protein A [Rhodothermales bacterium]|jgi:molybdopterin-guanine dinucleotide biosynthesis protein A
MAIAPKDVLSVLAAGGKSSRFGRDKASYVWEGQTLLERALQTASEISAETAVGLPPEHSDEPEGWHVLRKTGGVIVDNPAGIGPLGSLHAALQSAGSRWLLFLAVDLPLLEPAHLQLLLEAANEDVSAVVATRQDMIQPTCALYNTTLVPNVEWAIQGGLYALRSVFEGVAYTRVPLPDRALTNVNRLEDLPHSE